MTMMIPRRLPASAREKYGESLEWYHVAGEAKQIHQNYVVFRGMVDARKQTEKEQKTRAPQLPDIRKTRLTGSRGGGSMYRVGLQITSGYLKPIKLIVDIPSTVEGGTTLEHARLGEVFEIHASMIRPEMVNDRLADYTSDDDEDYEGMHYRDVALRVERVVPVLPHEFTGSWSSVWAEGRVLQPPAFFRHPDNPDVQLARVMLGMMALNLPGGEESLAEGVRDPVRTTVVVDVTNPDARRLYRQGNMVRVRGQLERTGLRVIDAGVDTKIAAIDAAWAQQKAETEGNPKARARAYAQYKRERDQFERQARLLVVAAEVELLEGGEATLNEAREARGQYNKTIRRDRTNRATAAAATREAPTTEQGDEATESEAPTPQRRRQRRRAAAAPEANQNQVVQASEVEAEPTTDAPAAPVMIDEVQAFTDGNGATLAEAIDQLREAGVEARAE